MSSLRFRKKGGSKRRCNRLAPRSYIRDIHFLPGQNEKEKFRSLWRETEIRPGLWVSVLDATISEHLSFNYHKENALIDFGFFLEGCFENNLQKTSIGPLCLKNMAGNGGIGFLREMSGTVTLPANKRTRIIHIHIKPDLLQTMLQDDMTNIPSDLKALLNNKKKNGFLKHQPLNPVVHTAANELFCGIKTNFCSKLYTEGKALELIALQLMWTKRMTPRCETLLATDEQNKIHTIRKQLEKNITSPPTLTALAREHRMSICKIQAGFKELYGMSVFGFFKEHKLQKAKMMLEEGDMNVSEVAWAIGYINISHFSAAYKKRFGVLPKKYLKAIRQKRTMCQAANAFRA